MLISGNPANFGDTVMNMWCDVVCEYQPSQQYVATVLLEGVECNVRTANLAASAVTV